MKIRNLSIALLVSSCFVSSCSKKEEVLPTSQAVTNKSDVFVSNGRLVFANSAVFEQIEKELEQKNTQKEGNSLDDWEKSLNFTSLRTAASKENIQLEKLQLANKPTPSHDLVESFGFPTFYATIINPSGEYQIGDKIYWFHDGFKHEANSESELQQIKQHPESSKQKFKAGSQLVEVNKIKASSQNKGVAPASAIQSNYSPMDGKYLYSFYLNNDPGSARRLIFGTYVYTEEVGLNGNVYTWHTIMYLRSTLEYYSNGRRAWYACDGNDRYQKIDVHFDGTAAREGQEFYGTHITTDVSSNITTSVNYDFTIADVKVQAPFTPDSNGYYPSHNPSRIFWNFTMTGSLYSYNLPDTNHAYSVGYPGFQLW